MPAKGQRSARYWVAAVIAVVVAFAAYGVWGWIAPDRQGAEQAVRDYLEAIQDDDVKAAQGFLRNVNPGERGIRVALADGPDWTVDEVAASWVTIGETTPVSVTISADDDVSATHELQVIEDGGWKIRDGLAELTFSGPLPWVDVNGERVSTDLPLRLFPGVYDFGVSLDEWFDATGQSRALLARPYELSLLGEDLAGARTLLEPAAELAAEVSDAVDEIVDDCARRASEDEPGCLIGEHVADDEGVPDRAEWEVTQYPEVTGVDDGREEFRIAVSEPATVTYRAGDVSKDCEVHVGQLSFVLPPEAELRMTVSEATPREDATWATCG